jgi:tetratricopeptide (TPR) repeat protein
MHRVVAVLVVCTAPPVVADDPAALVAEGRDLAQRGEYTRAIAKFKQADALAPSAAHACLIGLAYTRREAWSQAEIFLDRCREHATAADPVPEWFDAAVDTLRKKLVETDAAPIDIRVQPNVRARLTVSSFAPDESFEPRTIHLAPGTYTITATALGRGAATASLIVEAKAKQVVTLALPAPPPPPETFGHRLGGWLLLGAGATALVGGGLHLGASIERGKLADAAAHDDPVAWQNHACAFETLRAATIASYAVAAAAAVTGIVLRVRGGEPAITVERGGAVVGLEWRR